MKRISVMAGVLILASVVGCNNSLPVEVESSLYQGDTSQHHVEIDEMRYDGGARSGVVIHLKAIGAEDCSWCGITGHDDNGDGRWERIFYCGYPKQENGCNSVLFNDKGGRIWEPCRTDKDRVAPFTDEEVFRASALLYQAMLEIRKPEYRVRHNIRS